MAALRITDLATGLEVIRGGIDFHKFTSRPLRQARTLNTIFTDARGRRRKFRARIVGWKLRFKDGFPITDLRIKPLPRKKSRGMRRHIRHQKAGI